MNRIKNESIRRFAAILLLASAMASRAHAQQPAPPQQAPQPTSPAAPESSVNPPDQSQLENYHLPRTPEDFSTLTLDKSELKTFPPIPLSHATHDKFTFERVRVQWRELDPFELYILKPVGVEKPPVIVYLYGYPAGIDAFNNESWAERATSGGYAAVGFVGALTKDRFQSRPMKQTFLSELPESLGTTVHDVQMVLNYLQTRGDLDMSNVGLLGNGSGATVAILAAAADSRIKAVDALEPWGDWPNWVAKTINLAKGEREPMLTPEFLAKLAPLDPVKWLPKLTTQKVFLQFVDTEDALNQKAKADMEAAAPKNVDVYHYPSKVQHMAAVVGGRRFEWLKGQLQPLGQVSTSSQAQK